MKRETLAQRLCGFTDAELRTELRRRDRGDEDELFASTDVAFCEDCRRFSYGGTDENPVGICAAGKKMRFRVPHPGPHDPFGHYRIGCLERVAKLDAEEVRYRVELDVYVKDAQALCKQAWDVALPEHGPAITEMMVMLNGRFDERRCLATYYQKLTAAGTESHGIYVRQP